MDQSEIENKIRELDERVARLETRRVESTLTIGTSENIVRRVAQQVDKLSTRDLVLLALYVKPHQTVSCIKQMINGWGWSPDTFFEKNFGTALINNGLVQKIHDDADKKDYCLLTEKGKIEVEDILKKRNLQSSI